MSRLILKLETTKDCAYDLEYYGKLRGVIYDSISKDYPSLHNKPGYKYFCFSNIFPITDAKKGDAKTLIISSPDEDVLSSIYKNLPKKLQVGENEYLVKEKKPLKTKVKPGDTLITGTPIIVRIPKSSFEKYNITSPNDYVYWRMEFPANAFLNQLESNLKKKFSGFFGLRPEPSFPLPFESYEPRKEVGLKTNIKGNPAQLVGSLWKFKVGKSVSKLQLKFLQFCLDCGFGELNSYGFGFMNVVKR